MGCGPPSKLFSTSAYHQSNTGHPSDGRLPLETPLSTIAMGPIVAPISSPQQPESQESIEIRQPSRPASEMTNDKTSDIVMEAKVTDDPVTVFPSTAEPELVTQEDEDDPLRLRDKCPRFRVLIIGKANAGKTTILQKMCNTTEQPIIHNQAGVVLDPSVIQPTDGRGIHDIENELTFSSNPGFVFHDSPGFEAASVGELEAVQGFIAKRAATSELKDQLHAIWFCLPTDNDRPLCDAEMRFFEQGTGRIPVVAIFTKYDGMILREYNRLRYEKHCSRSDAKVQASIYADKLFKESKHYLKRLHSTPHPPLRALRVQDMHKPEVNCAELSKQTLAALDNKILQRLFVSVQQNNLGLCTEFAIKEFMLPALAGIRSQDPMVERILNCYGFFFNRVNYDACDTHLVGSDKAQGLTTYFREHDEDVKKLIQVLRPVSEETPSRRLAKTPPPFQVLRVGIAVLILAEDSFWMKKPDVSGLQALEVALANYQAASTGSAVQQEVERRFNKVNLQDLATKQKDSLVREVAEIVRKFKKGT